MKTKPGFVATAAKELKLDCIKVTNNEELLSALNDKDIDFLIVCAFGLKLSEEVLNVAKYDSLNIHASLLPRWRGAAPIVRAIEAGDKTTGATIMQMAKKIDAGAIIKQSEISITDDDTAGTLYPKLSDLGADLIIDTLLNYESITPIKQDLTQVTYANKLIKEERKINWNDTAKNIEFKIRAFNPSPGLYSVIYLQIVTIYKAKIVYQEINPGELIHTDDKIIIGCSENSLEILEVKPSGKTQMSISAWLRGLRNK